MNVRSVAKWAVFLLYLALSAYTMAHHELWGDELHSWNIARSTSTFADLIANTRYEGHPPGWYVVLWSISRFTHDLAWIQAVHWVIITSAVSILVFFSPLPLSVRLLTPFGYFFLFEYAVLSRNYAIGILLVFSICLVVKSRFRYRVSLYYILLFALSNTHLLSVLLAAGLHLYFLMLSGEQGDRRRVRVLHIVWGILVLLPALYFICPPQDSTLSFAFFLGDWHLKERLGVILLAPLKAFIPIPAWWEYSCWNTQFLLEAQQRYRWLRPFTLLLTLALPCLAAFILKDNKKSLVLFIANLVLTAITAAIFPLTSIRYTGFIFIGFIAAYWLYTAERLPGMKADSLANILLLIQLFGSTIIIPREMRYPFSNAYRVHELLKEVPANEQIVTDYWCLDMLSAYTDKPLYCIDLRREASFIQWSAEFKTVINTPALYYNGMEVFLQREGIKETYMITSQSPEGLALKDPRFLKAFDVELIDKKEHAIERSSNLYLYRIRKL